MSIHIPYTYLIGWSSTDKYYYGVRFAKNCNPSELFITYFTSSNKRRWSNLEFKNKAKSRKHINNGKTSKLVLPNQLDLFLSSGWKLGRLLR